MFELELFPAREGDAMILAWGREDAPCRMLIDAGREPTAAAIREHAKAKGLGKDAFELLIITHIDRDHIEGTQHLLRDDDFRPLVKAVWFNGRDELEPTQRSNEFETFSAVQGERVSRLLREHGVEWNPGWSSGSVAITGDALPRLELVDGLVLTLLSPDLKQLAALAGPWDEAMEAAPSGWENFDASGAIALDDLAGRRFKSDRAKPNGSSIALMAEYEGRRILLGADAHVQRLLTSLDLYEATEGSAAITLVKAPHHGSRANVSIELVERTACSHWVFSTNGDQFRHPDPEAVARVVKHAPQPPSLYFNYETEETAMWRGQTRPPRAFTTIYGRDGYLRIDLSAL